jgi:hypothetical protein
VYTELDKILEKPPLGVMPKKIWIETRIDELRLAISRYLEVSEYEKAEDLLREIKELAGLL